MAADLEEQAKTEEVGFVTMIDLFGRKKTFHRYALPYVAEGLRKAAAEMAD